MKGHEGHVMPDGSEHEAGECPPDCTITDRLRSLLDDLDSGRMVITRVS